MLPLVETLRNPIVFQPLAAGSAALLASACVLALARCAVRPAPVWGAGFAVGIGYLVGHVVLFGRPGLGDAPQRFFWLTLAAVVFGVVLSWVRPAVLLLTLGFVFASAGCGVLLLPFVRDQWPWSESAAWLLGLGVAGLACGYFFDDLAAQPGPLPALLPTTLALATAAVLVLTGSALLGQLGGVAFAALVPVLAWACFAPRFAPGRAFAAVLTVLLPGLWLMGRMLSDTPTGSVLLLAAALPLAWLARRIPGTALRVFRPALGLVPMALAVVLVVPPSTPGDAEDYSRIPPQPATTSPPPSPSSDSDDNPFRDVVERQK